MKKTIGCMMAVAIVAAGARLMHQQKQGFPLSPAEKQSLRDAPSGGPVDRVPALTPPRKLSTDLLRNQLFFCGLSTCAPHEI